MERYIFQAKLWMRINPNLVCSIHLARNNYSIKINELTSKLNYARISEIVMLTLFLNPVPSENL